MKKIVSITLTALFALPMMSHAASIGLLAVPAPAIPEPSTIFAGVAVLVPLGISAVQILRKNRRK